MEKKKHVLFNVWPPCGLTSSSGADMAPQQLGWTTNWDEGNGTPLQYSCLENTMDRGAWWAAVHGVPKSQT